MVSTWISAAMREELLVGASGFLFALSFALICFLAGFWLGYRGTGAGNRDNGGPGPDTDRGPDGPDDGK